MKILWLSNSVLTPDDQGRTGTWLGAMAQRLVASGEVELGNISNDSVAQLVRRDCGSIRQWVVPTWAVSDHSGLPAPVVVEDIMKAVNEFAPDLVHVWGTESYWGLLTGRKLIPQPALLETQGLKFAIAEVFDGGLSSKEQLACIGIKEIVRGSTIPQKRKKFEQWADREKEIISRHRFITVQSKWLESQVRGVNATPHMFHNDFVLREPFHTAEPWHDPEKPAVFCTAAYPTPFKGLHVAIRAVALLKNVIPSIQVRIAGPLQGRGIRQDGYITWVGRELRRLGIERETEWLGPLSADQIVAELQRCSAFVMPSFVEGYCVGLAEAMMMGVPSVVSRVGGAAGLAVDENSALFFQAGDEAMCAHQLRRVLTDQELADRLSRNARSVGLERNDSARIVARQLDIYRQVIAREASVSVR